MSKPCKACLQVKALTEFPPESRNKDGRSGRCRACRVPPDPEKRKAYLAVYKAKNAESIREKARAYYLSNRKAVIEKSSARQRTKKAERREWAARYRSENRESIRRYFREYVAKRAAEDEDFRQMRSVRLHMNNALKAIKDGLPGSGAPQTLGYSLETLKSAIEARFQPGMRWANHGEWHVDHKIPVLHFILKGEIRPSVVHAICNLQPLWAAENIAKGNKHPLHLEQL